MCLKSNETGAVKFFINNWTTNIIPFKYVHLGSHTPLKTLLLLPVAVLEVFMWKCSQLLCYNLSDVSTAPKWQPLRWNLSFGRWKKSQGLRSGEYGRCRTTGISFLVKNLFMEIAVWQGALSWCSIQVSTISGWNDEPFFWVVQGPHDSTDHSDVKCWSDLMRALTLVTFSSIFDVQGVPEQGSSSTLSRPSKNALCHLKTCALDTACSP